MGENFRGRVNEKQIGEMLHKKGEGRRGREDEGGKVRHSYRGYREGGIFLGRVNE